MVARRSTLAALAITLASTGYAPSAVGGNGVSATFGQDRFLAGGTVERTEAVEGDLVATGGELEIAAPVAGDAVLAGGRLRLGGRFAQDLYAAGGSVALDGKVEGNARMAGGEVRIASGAELERNLTVAGGKVAIRGDVRGYVQAAGGEVFIDGPVGGDVRVYAGSLELGPNARITGKVTYRGREALRRHPGAEVAGGIERSARVDRRGPERSAWGGGWLWTTGLVLLAAAMAGTMPAVSTRLSAALRASPGLAVLFGFIALVCIPVGAVLLMVTVLGIPVAILALLLYLALLIVGYIATGVGLGLLALERYERERIANAAWRVGAAALAMLAVALLGRIPYVGGLVVLGALLAGMGAVLIASRRAFTASA